MLRLHRNAAGWGFGLMVWYVGVVGGIGGQGLEF